MAITLNDIKLNSQDKIVKSVIDEFAKSSYLLDNMTFDNSVTAGSGSTLTYGYTRLTSQPTAAFRAINGNYIDSNVTKQRYTVDLKTMGGSFSIDRVLANASANALVDEVQLQMNQKIKAVKSLFHDTVINGDSAIDTNSFDGLNKALTGGTTEYGAGASIDLSTTAQVTANYIQFLDALEEFLATLDDTPSCLAMNTKMLIKIKDCARRAGYYTRNENAFGKTVEMFDNIPLVDLGNSMGVETPVVKIVDTRKPDGTNVITGLTDIYAIRFGLDGFHGVSLANGALVSAHAPDFTTAGTVKQGDVEMTAAIALKSTKAAGVFRNVKVK